MIKCINQQAQLLAPELELLCLTDANDKACVKTVLGMRECLILNECYLQGLEDDVK